MHVAHSKENHSRVCFLAFEDVSQYALGSSAPEKVFFSPNIYIYIWLNLKTWHPANICAGMLIMIWWVQSKYVRANFIDSTRMI